MKLYTISYQDGDDTTIEWFGTQIDFKKRQKELSKSDFVTGSKIVDFPTDKTNILSFLQRYIPIDPDELIAILPTYKSKGSEVEADEEEAA